MKLRHNQLQKPSDDEIERVLDSVDGDRTRARRRLASRYPGWIHTEDARRRLNPAPEDLFRRLMR